MNSIRILLAFLAMVTVTGCSSISLVNSWKDPGLTTKHYHKLLIVGIADRVQSRQVFEEVYASEVRKLGIVGIASYSITGVNDKLTRSSIEEAVKKTGADGVITTRMVGLSSKKDVRSGFVMTDRGLADVYGIPVSYAEFVHQPVEVTMSTKATIETNLFDTGTGHLVWSGTSSAVPQEGLITTSRDLADSVIKAMARDGLL